MPESSELTATLLEPYGGPERRRWVRQGVSANPLARPLALELERARRLAASLTANRLAATAVAAKADHLVQSRRRRLERAERMAVFRTLARRPGHLWVLCAWRSRVRVWTGGWVLMPAGLEEALLYRARPLVTHGVCLDCARRASSGMHAEP